MRLHPGFVILAVILCLPLVSAAQPEGGYADYLVGTYLLEEGKVADAVEYLESAWRSSDGDPAVGMKLAESYYLLKNYTRCELVVDEVLDEDPNHREALITKAKVCYLRRDARSAVQYLERVREHHPPSFEVERLLGNIYYELADVDEALEAYRRCLNIDASSPYIQYRYGRLLVAAGREEEAEDAFRRARELDPGFAEPLHALIDLLVDTGRSEEALPMLEEALNADPRNERAMLTLAGIYLELGRYDDGIALIEGWRAHSPLSAEAQITLGRLQFENGDFQAAKEIFAELFEQNPSSAEMARVLAEVELGLGDTDAARRYFERAIEIDPEDFRSYVAMFFAATPRFADTAAGETVLPLDDDERRALLSDAAVVAPKEDFDANYLLGVSFLELDMLDEAGTHLRRARDLRERDYNTLFNLATVFERQGEYAEAEGCLEVMIELRPDDPNTLNFYGYLLALMQKDLPRALDMVQQALAGNPENGYYLDSLGWIYYQMGDYGRAVVELEKAAGIVKDDPTILEHLGDAYRGARRFEEARSAYQRCHEIQGGDEILEKIQSTRGHN